MNLLRAATLTCADAGATARRYVDWLDYEVVEDTKVDAALAGSWGAPACEGRRMVVCRPASDAEIFLRFVESSPHPDYRALRSFGWAAIEICVSDVLTVAERMARSPFRIIGPPKRLDGLPTIFPMQVQGPDQEVVFLTEIQGDLPEYNLPRARALVDHLFILVLACSDLDASAGWLEQTLGLSAGRPIELEYGVLSDAFGLPSTHKHAIATLTHERDVFLEIDQYPGEATPRPHAPGELAPGVALATLLHPELGAIQAPWITPPALHPGAIYDGRPSGVLRGPDGTLVEVVQAA